MKTHFNQSLLCISLLVILQASAPARCIAQGFSPETKAKLKQVLKRFQNDPEHPYAGGIAVAIKVDGLAFWQGASGYAARNIDEQNNLLPGGTPFTKDTLSRIYSVTKTFTAALVLELAQKGVFKLDEPVSKYLPLLGIVNPGINSSVTLHQLLAHESGYSDYTAEMDLQVAVAFDPRHLWTPYEMVSFVHQIAAPGSERRYSSTNYVLLGAVIEAATGKPAEKFYRERFFKPLKLHSMYFGGREIAGNRGSLASPHDSISAFNPIFMATGQPTFPEAYTNISRFPLDAIVSLAFTGGAIVSDVADLAEWGNALFGGRATSKAVLDTMLNSISTVPDEDGDRLGYGVFTNTRISDKDYFIGHDGNAPGYRSVMFYQPDRKMTIALLTNFYGSDPYEIAKAVYEALPDFLCGNQNSKESKVLICYNGNNLCADRKSASEYIQKGAYLGTCCQSSPKADGIVQDDIKTIPAKDKLSVSPNPVTDRAVISFEAKQRGHASLSLFDMSGKMVVAVFNGMAEKGMLYHRDIQAGKLPAGLYICRLQTESGISQQKIMLRR